MLQLEVNFFDPAQKQIPAPDFCRGEIKIFDPSSRAQIHLGSKSQIVRARSRRSASDRRTSHADRLKSQIASQLT
jgi:hypothetical protein